MTDDPDDGQANEEDPDGVDEDIGERILENGEEVAYQEWDSGGPGAGAGRVSVYEYAKKFYVLNDEGMDGPFGTKAEAITAGGVNIINDATKEIWGCD